ncbi:MAG: DUF5063 domain-containing protein [Bacteroidia bacterium]|nr:DUF5063 domain-containing protein [Bacteroidia bacterium]
MTTKESDSIIYSSTVIDFVTVAVEFCLFLENENSVQREDWIGKMLKLLPLIYVKASLLPQNTFAQEESLELFVKEADYNRVATSVAQIMGDENVYLDVFVEDMKYSDRPVSAFVSENIADIYQDVRNFISIYQFGLTEQMNDALFVCKQSFENYWGQRLVNVLRPLHALSYKSTDDDETDLLSETDITKEELWD